MKDKQWRIVFLSPPPPPKPKTKMKKIPQKLNHFKISFRLKISSQIFLLLILVYKNFLTLDYIERTSGCFRLFTRVVTFDVTKTKKQSAQCQVLFNFFQKLKEESNKFHFTKKLTKPDSGIPFITPIVGLGNTFLPKLRFFFGLYTTACLQKSKIQFSSSHCKKPVNNSFYAELWTKEHWLNSVGKFLISNKKPTKTRLKKQEKTKKSHLVFAQ